MSTYTATISWERGEQDFLDKCYSRAHRWKFDGGLEITGSSSPHSVPLPYSDAAAVDPEEAFVAAISSCHMLWFLALAAQKHFRVDRYVDDADGLMEKNAQGRYAITVVTLHPRVSFSGERRPTQAEFDALQQLAHEECFIANSVKSEVRCEPAMID